MRAWRRREPVRFADAVVGGYRPVDGEHDPDELQRRAVDHARSHRTASSTNWINVGYYSGATDKLNSFQLLLVDRGDVGPGDFDIVFNYWSVLWETGSASGGSGDFGCSPARVGFANGDCAYDAAGNVESITDPAGGVARFTYDASNRCPRHPLGRRIEVAGPQGVKRFGYGSEDNASVEYDGSDAGTAVHTFGPLLDQPLATRRGERSYYPLQDALVNNVTSVTDAGGATVERFRCCASTAPTTPRSRRWRAWSGCAG